MIKVLDRPVQCKVAAKRFLTLHQGSHSVTEYALESQMPVVDSGWNGKALHVGFHIGFSDQIKDELAVRDDPAGWDSLISLATRLDNCLWECCKQKQGCFLQSTIPRLQSPPTPANPSPSLSAPQGSSGSTTPSTPDEEPMQVGRAHLSLTEGSRRLRVGLCLYCG